MAGQAPVAPSPKLAQKRLKQNVSAALLRTEELEATVTDFNGDQGLLHQRIRAYAKALEHLQANSVDADVEVPQEVVQYVDEGGHPDVWTAEAFRRINLSNQLVNGKVADLRSLRDQLLQEAEAIYPEEAAAYKAALGSASAAEPAATQ